MKRMRVLYWVLLAIAVFGMTTGCGARQGAIMTETSGLDEPEMSYKRVESEPAVDSAAAGAGAGLPDTDEVVRKIIYSVEMHLIVEDADATLVGVQGVTEEVGGFIAEANVWRSEGHRQATIVARVPAEALEEALAAYRALALDIEREDLDSQDVTEEYVDLEARLRNEQRTEEELLELLESRSETGKTQDILEVHRELRSVRAEIERIQGRMRYLENLSDLATVRITLTPDELMQPIAVGGWRPQGTARGAIRALIRTLQFFADAAIILIFYILPVLIVVAIPVTVIVLVIRVVVRRARKRRRARAEE